MIPLYERLPGLGVRHPPRDVADRVPYSWGETRGRAGPRHRRRRRDGRVRLLRAHSLRIRGVGINCHYSGSQYNMGRKIPTAQNVAVTSSSTVLAAASTSSLPGPGADAGGSVHRINVKISRSAPVSDPLRHPLHRVLIPDNPHVPDFQQFRRRRGDRTFLAAVALALSSAVPAGASRRRTVGSGRCRSFWSAGAPGDPVAIANASLAATAQATRQATMDLGRKVPSPGWVSADRQRGVSSGQVRGPQAIEYVARPRRIAAGRSVLPWGGGAINGPSEGRRPGHRQDRLRLLGSSGTRLCLCRACCCPSIRDQYNAGQARSPVAGRSGDLIFYGPDGSQHVTIYLGNGQMLEASSAAGHVTVSPVRTAGMTPYLTRIIET